MVRWSSVGSKGEAGADAVTDTSPPSPGGVAARIGGTAGGPAAQWLASGLFEAARESDRADAQPVMPAGRASACLSSGLRPDGAAA
ncbi:hypothetical protein GCM10009533_04930 [Saccharopolyspora spinosporotrichia]|uniref:Uncharacterized protein n=1 Tax=Saccharopolyspora erythraea TaxID=1836 RepID=A0ABN1C071_SACER